MFKMALISREVGKIKPNLGQNVLNTTLVGNLVEKCTEIF